VSHMQHKQKHANQFLRIFTQKQASHEMKENVLNNGYENFIKKYRHNKINKCRVATN
jgi:hypothetical protein